MVILSPRDVYFGNPPSDDHEPVPKEIVDLLDRIMTMIASGANYYTDTLTELEAITGADGDVGFVLDDGTASNNGVYSSDGEDWTKTADLPEGFAAIADGAISNAKLADVATATIKGRATAGSGDVEDLSVAQVLTLLSLSNVDDTADADKPVSTATQTALDLKADAADVSNVDNTSDEDKPVSTATQTALDLKADGAPGGGLLVGVVDPLGFGEVGIGVDGRIIGDRISITGDVTMPGDMTLPAGGDLTFNNDAEILLLDGLGFGFRITDHSEDVADLLEVATPAAYVDSNGLPAYGPLLGDTLGRVRGKLRRLDRGETESLRIGFIGDSWTDRALWRIVVADHFYDRCGKAGIGFIRLAFKSSETEPLRYHMLADGDDVTVVASANWTGESRTAETLITASAVSSTAGAKFTISGDDASLLGSTKLLYLPQTGAAQYRWDGGSWNSLDTSTGNGATINTDRPSSGAWTLEIEVVSGTVEVVGITTVGDGNGAILDNLGFGNTDTADWSTQMAESSAQAHFSAIDYDGIVIQLGTNDIESGTGITADDYATNLMTMVSTLRTIYGTDINIAIIAPAQNLRTSGDSARMETFITAARLACVQNRVAFHTLQDGFGDPTDGVPDYSDLFSDDQHPNGTPGGRIMADTIIALIEG